MEGIKVIVWGNTSYCRGEYKLFYGGMQVIVLRDTCYFMEAIQVIVWRQYKILYGGNSSYCMEGYKLCMAKPQVIVNTSDCVGEYKLLYGEYKVLHGRIQVIVWRDTSYCKTIDIGGCCI